MTGRHPGGADRELIEPEDLKTLTYDDRGLVPVVAQDHATGAVLMVAWANREALERSLESGQMHFWSRSRGTMWRKGETSGNFLELVSLHADCDADTVLALVDPAGPACHTGDVTCFGSAATKGSTLERLWSALRQRDAERPTGSYTTRLLEDENLRLKKLGEETAELVTALARGEGSQATLEAADLLYHTLVALLAEGATLFDLLDELEKRRGSG